MTTRVRHGNMWSEFFLPSVWFGPGNIPHFVGGKGGSSHGGRWYRSAASASALHAGFWPLGGKSLDALKGAIHPHLDEQAFDAIVLLHQAIEPCHALRLQ